MSETSLSGQHVKYTEEERDWTLGEASESWRGAEGLREHSGRRSREGVTAGTGPSRGHCACEEGRGRVPHVAEDSSWRIPRMAVSTNRRGRREWNTFRG